MLPDFYYKLFGKKYKAVNSDIYYKLKQNIIRAEYFKPQSISNAEYDHY